MRSRKATWLSGIGAVVLVVGLVVANYGSGVPQAVAQAAPPNPLTVIINKLNEILAAIGGIQQGNHTLRWDTNNPSASRFVTAFTGAVLDKNTGLVWEQAPDTTTQSWDDARRTCVNKTIGGTRGWRLPSVAELASVIDPSLPAPFVPASVFTGVQSGERYWTTSSNTNSPTTVAWAVGFAFGIADTNGKTSTNAVWCVRGGMNGNQY